MREIKFRVWDVSDKRFLDWKTEIKYSVAHVNKFQQEGCWVSVFGFVLDSPRHEIQQFTGLKDKNGKEIYEGDILASDCHEKPCNYKVVWNDERSGDYCGFMLQAIMKDPPRVTFHIHNFKMWMAEGFSVIGNIFENPELNATST